MDPPQTVYSKTVLYSTFDVRPTKSWMIIDVLFPRRFCVFPSLTVRLLHSLIVLMFLVLIVLDLPLFSFSTILLLRCILIVSIWV